MWKLQSYIDIDKINESSKIMTELCILDYKLWPITPKMLLFWSVIEVFYSNATIQ